MIEQTGNAPFIELIRTRYWFHGASVVAVRSTIVEYVVVQSKLHGFSENRRPYEMAQTKDEQWIDEKIEKQK